MDLPLLGMPARFDREITLPVPPGHVWDRYDVVCLHEHSGSFRESWASRSLRGRPVRACSVAERRTSTPPSPGNAHVIGDVLAFLSVYPHPIPLVTGHVTCGDANFASWTTWADKIASGAMLARAEEIHYFRSLGALAAMEQPPTAHEVILGPASFQTAAELHGERNTKTYLWFARGLDTVSPSDVVPEHMRVNFKASVAGSPEEKMLQRSFIARSVADAHTATWLPQLAAVPASYARPAAEPCDTYEAGRAALQHNFRVFSARYAPRIDEVVLADPKREWRAVVIIPMHAADGTWALRPAGALYGGRHDPTVSLEVQAKALGAFLGGGVPPALACVAPNATKDYIVIMPHTERPLRGADGRSIARADGVGGPRAHLVPPWRARRQSRTFTSASSSAAWTRHAAPWRQRKASRSACGRYRAPLSRAWPRTSGARRQRTRRPRRHGRHSWPPTATQRRTSSRSSRQQTRATEP